MDITKESGEKEEYNHEKFCESLSRAGASADVVERVCGKIAQDLRHGMTTEELFKRTFQYLSEEDITSAAKYSLRRGIASLGPAGFLFEQYVERILNVYEYKTRRNVFMKGVCVSHEVDIVANKEKNHFLVEVKYHNQGGIKTDITVIMYADARLGDITPAQEKREGGRMATHTMWIITNTKLTKTAIQYGKCKNIKMTGWSYPNAESLEKLIIQKKLYPVTVLPSIAGGNIALFAREGLMLVSDLIHFTPAELANKLGIHQQQTEKIIGEALVCLAGEKFN